MREDGTAGAVVEALLAKGSPAGGGKPRWRREAPLAEERDAPAFRARWRASNADAIRAQDP
jgi:hypothetical protein